MDDGKESKSGVDWQKLVTANWELINQQARRRFGDSTLAEEAALAVLDGLLQDGAKRMKSYQGRGVPRAFLAAVSWRLLEDFARSRFGRKRAPGWIRQLGGIWEKLYTLLCLERFDITDAVMAIAGDVEAKRTEEAAWTIRQRIEDCGSHQALEVDLDEEKLSGAESSVSPAQVEEQQKDELFRHLFLVLTDLPQERIEKESTKLARLNLSLTAEERLLLRLCFVDELSVTRAGEMLGINRFQAHGRIRRVLAKIRDELGRAGLDSELLELLR